MYIDNRIFNEIIYIKPSKLHRIYPGAEQPNDYDAIAQLLRDHICRDPGETEEAYADRIDQELDNYPMLGVIPKDSLLASALANWQYNTCTYLGLHDIIESDSTIDHCYYFWTRDSNYDAVEMDLLHGNGTGKLKRQFIDELNKPTYDSEN